VNNVNNVTYSYNNITSAEISALSTKTIVIIGVCSGVGFLFILIIIIILCIKLKRQAKKAQ
jgi:hypothetical protein